MAGLIKQEAESSVKDEPDRSTSSVGQRPQSSAGGNQTSGGPSSIASTTPKPPPTPTPTDVKAKPSVPKKTFSADELRNCLMPIWDKLERMDEAIPFRVPVDPELLQIEVSYDSSSFCSLHR